LWEEDAQWHPPGAAVAAVAAVVAAVAAVALPTEQANSKSHITALFTTTTIRRV
jgi:hypothetical protein